MSDQKNDGNKGSSQSGNQNKGSGSDTVSAAKISAGSSVGTVGQSPMPESQGGQGKQSATLSSHTSSPLGGQPTSKTHGKSSQSGDVPSRGGQSDQGRDSARGGGEGGMGEQVQERAGEAYEQATEWARSAYDQASSWASDTLGEHGEQVGRMGRRSMRGLRRRGSGVQRYVAENPVMVGIVGLAAGLLIGALLPRTRRENEMFGEWADEVRQQGLRYAHDMAQRGREFVDETFSGDDPRFAHHESEYAGGRQEKSANRH